MSQLPILTVIPELLSGIQQSPQLIVKAAPGAGKSTYFPLALLKSGLIDGKIVMLEPRRLAARNIARYLALQLGETVGETVGYRVRGESKTSRETRLEVVTEGIMTRMIQNDPELEGIGALIFDEFHERSIHADTALAFSLEVQSALREDLKIIVMSATLDHAALQQLLPLAKYVESAGRGFPIDVRYQPLKANERFVPAMAKQIHSLMNNESGSLLAFLPGAGSIVQLKDQLTALPDDVDVCPIYGQMSFADQQKAIAPSPNGRRKVVLATNIAETSLTIEGIRMVVDSGLERVARFDLKTGITKLEQVRIAQSSAEQRAGRAGRLEPGICVRLYSEAQFNQQPKVPTPEILQSDLAPLVLELALWGVISVDELLMLDLPSTAALNQARALLHQLGLIDVKGQLTSAGQDAHHLGVEPRVAAMLIKAQNKSQKLFNSALALAALLEEPEKQIVDIQHSLHRWQQGQHPKSKLMNQRANALAHKLDDVFSLHQVHSDLVAIAACLAFPDRIAQKRGQTHGQFLLANGHGAFVDEDQALAGSEYLVAVDLMRSHGQSSRIFSALELDIQLLEQQFSPLFASSKRVDWDEKVGRLVAEELCCIGDVIVRRRILPEPDKQKMTQALLNYVERKGLSVLNWDENTRQWLERVRCAAEWIPDESWPEMDDDSLLAEVRQWLEPYLVGITSVKALKKVSIKEALNARLGWPLNQQLDEWLPVAHQLPTGTLKKIRYQYGQEPVLSVRMQEVFGEKSTPVIAKGNQAIVMELLSPAQRPLQVTRDLAGFWTGAYKEVQKEMKGRYPKHLWPDDPANHVATTKTKRQLNHD